MNFKTFFLLIVVLIVGGMMASSSKELYFPDSGDIKVAIYMINGTGLWNLSDSGTELIPTDAELGMSIPFLADCDTIDTDADGVFSCGTDATGTGLINGSDVNFSNLNATKIIATNITATRFTGAVDCGMIDGGSDGDFCADETAAGGMSSTAQHFSNITEFIGEEGNASLIKTLNTSWIEPNFNLGNISNYTEYLRNDGLNNSAINITFLNVHQLNGTDLSEFNYSLKIDTVEVAGEVTGTIGATTLSDTALDDQYCRLGDFNLGNVSNYTEYMRSADFSLATNISNHTNLLSNGSDVNFSNLNATEIFVGGVKVNRSIDLSGYLTSYTETDPTAITNNSDANISSLYVYQLNGTDLSEYNYSVMLDDYISDASAYMKSEDFSLSVNISNYTQYMRSTDFNLGNISNHTNLLSNGSDVNFSNLNATEIYVGGVKVNRSIDLSGYISDASLYQLEADAYKDTNATYSFGNRTGDNISFVGGNLWVNMTIFNTEAQLTGLLDDNYLGVSTLYSAFVLGNITEFLGVNNESILTIHNLSSQGGSINHSIDLSGYISDASAYQIEESAFKLGNVSNYTEYLRNDGLNNSAINISFLNVHQLNGTDLSDFNYSVMLDDYISDASAYMKSEDFSVGVNISNYTEYLRNDGLNNSAINITFLNVYQINGTDLSIYAKNASEYVDRDDWTSIDDYPTDCTNEFVYGLADTLTCSAVTDEFLDLNDITIIDFTNDAFFISNGTDANLTNLNVFSINGTTLSDYNTTVMMDNYFEQSIINTHFTNNITSLNSSLNNYDWVRNSTSNVNFKNLTLNNASIGGHALTVEENCINWTVGTSYFAFGSGC